MRDESLGALKEVKIEFEGRTIVGQYSFSNGVIGVLSAAGGIKTTQIGGAIHFPEGVARMMLRALAQEGKA
jgi:hypothetical protein